MNNLFMCTSNCVVIPFLQNLFFLIKSFKLNQLRSLPFKNLSSLLVISIDILKWSKM
jgi:hypothetical protein